MLQRNLGAIPPLLSPYMAHLYSAQKTNLHELSQRLHAKIAHIRQSWNSIYGYMCIFSGHICSFFYKNQRGMQNATEWNAQTTMAKQEQQLVWSDYGFSFKLFCAILFRSGHTFPGGVNQMGSVSHMINVRRGKHIVGGGVQIPRAFSSPNGIFKFCFILPGSKKGQI